MVGSGLKRNAGAYASRVEKTNKERGEVLPGCERDEAKCPDWPRGNGLAGPSLRTNLP